MNSFTDTHGILTAFFDALPWPVLMLDEGGRVTFLNRELRRANRTPDSPADSSLAALFPEYFSALRGDIPWLTEQTANVIRSANGARIAERISLQRLPFGACLFVTVQPDNGGAAEDPQLARLASLGFMVAGVCHELANPLTAINSTVQLLRATPDCTPELLEKGLTNIASNVRRVLNISRRLNDFSRVNNDARTLFNLRSAVNDAIYLLRHGSLMQDVEIVCVLDEAMNVHGDSDQLQQVFCNVFTNAAQAISGRGHLYITGSRCDTHFVEIAIRDTGPGIDEANLPRLFEPFFTTKAAGEGTGLGLAISNEIVLAHGGSMFAANSPQGGACFYIRLPAAS